jgi:hypothetical protein
MKFRNPWIDPRIVEAKPEAAQGYLLDRGWKLVGPAANPVLLMYEAPGNGEDTPPVLVPLHLDEGPMLQRMIDLVAELAHREGRWAVDVLRDILAQPIASHAANGPAAVRSQESQRR